MSTATGNQAESAACDFLMRHGFTIVERNWRNRLCEIDIVAHKKRTVYFVEVKYRQTNQQGGGLDYITPRKLKQMRFAAENWLSSHKWRGLTELAAMEVRANFSISEFLECLDDPELRQEL